MFRYQINSQENVMKKKRLNKKVTKHLLEGKEACAMEAQRVIYSENEIYSKLNMF